jgi:hypothetical protein
MKKFVPIGFILAAFIAAGAGLAITRSIHNQAMQESPAMQDSPPVQASSDAGGAAAGSPSQGPGLQPSDGAYLSQYCEQPNAVCDLMAY